MLLVAAIACSGEPEGTPTGPGPPPPAGVSHNGSFEDQVLNLVNQHRASGATCGSTMMPAVGPLTMDATLRTVARQHSADMAANGYVSHTGLDGRTPDQRIRDAGYGLRFAWGENIAAGQSTPQGVVDAWMSSPSHCSNIMSPAFRASGIGHAVLSGSPLGDYWTQVFTDG